MSADSEGDTSLYPISASCNARDSLSAWFSLQPKVSIETVVAGVDGGFMAK
jgi:hypothetical protein